MDPSQKYQILTEGQKFGVSKACQDHGISRTLYYRWLNRYKAHGMDGLSLPQKGKLPVNKTSKAIENKVLMLVKKHPKYGPREIKYLLEEMGYALSESAVYNIFKRNNLSTKENRLKFSKKKEALLQTTLPDFENMLSGECWLFWTIPYGQIETEEMVYEYTIFDYKSKIACSRLYSGLSLKNFEDLLTAVAIPVAQGLSFNTKHLCFFDDYNLPEKSKLLFIENIHKIVQSSGYEITTHQLKGTDAIDALSPLRSAYTGYCLSFLMPFLQSKMGFSEVKLLLQQHIRRYNLNHQLTYEDMTCSPIEYHMRSTGTDRILPLWAYIDRLY